MPLAPWPARLFVAVFTLAIVVCGTLSIEAWPFTGWRLFSHERRAVTASWAAATVDGRGRETLLQWERFPPADRHFLSIMSSFEHRTAAEQEAVCRTWARLQRRHAGVRARAVRIYRTMRDMRRHVGRRAPVEPERRLRWTCARAAR